ncbi:rhamnulokinase [Novipirellula artificiosorum]|uniref:Rhamnulokinase n=1 Tax=Novipirellula artificiosorum TaxID=2528016 RepID=A0A5C6D555_9BACT|nr:rhamnulokinase family protein [Novipirellula artificiosorum]TWU31024.1 Rhamnulokinase [Novipirellula artificiosorum]
MSSASTHLAIDLGASSGRVMAGFLENNQLKLAECHRFVNDPVFIQQSMQWNVHGLWSEIQNGLRKAANEYKNIRSAGVDTWGVDYALLDDQDLVAGPIRHYRDARTRGMMQRAWEIVPRDQIFQATGLQFMELNTLFQLVAARLNHERSLDVANGMLLMGDFFHWLLTGQRSVDVTNASTTQLLDPRTQQWSTDLIRRFNLPPAIFRDCIQPGTSLGPIQTSVAETTGLGNVEVIVPATHDTASAVIAVPAKNFAPEKPDWCYISSGTWSLMGCELSHPLVNERCSELNFTNEGGIHGSTRLLKNICGLWIFQQIRKSLDRRGAAESWDEMVARASEAAPFSLYLDPDDDAFVAPSDMVDAVIGYAARTGQHAPENNGVLYRSALEGLVFRYRDCLTMLESLVEHRIEVIHIVGGGSRNKLLCQMTADACDRPVVAGPVEATAAGNVVVQMLGCGEINNITEARQLISNSFGTEHYLPKNTETWSEAASRFASQ